MIRVLPVSALAVIAISGAMPATAGDGDSRLAMERSAGYERYVMDDGGYERDATRAEWRRVEKHLRSLGYSHVHDVDVEGNLFDVDAISPKGREVDVRLDRDNLRILSVRRS